MCEAKHIKTSNDEVCVIPFKYQNSTFDSCSHDINEMASPDGKPWCATKVNEQGFGIEFALCEDERHQIIKGSGNGHKCALPFLFNRVWYDSCTRRDHEGIESYKPYHWCPDPRQLNESLIFETGGFFGYCPKILEPVRDGCAENYDPISEEVCVRVSAYPETYEDAKAKCESEGGFLFQHINQASEVSQDTLNTCLHF